MFVFSCILITALLPYVFYYLLTLRIAQLAWRGKEIIVLLEHPRATCNWILVGFVCESNFIIGSSILLLLCYHSYENVEEMDNDLKPVKALSPVVKLSKDDYECLPSYMKGLAPWEV